jgi:hypothetical protein
VEQVWYYGLPHTWLTILPQIEGEADDPRNFQASGPPFEDGTTPGGGPGLENFFSTH